MSSIPISKDYADVVGKFGQKIENRSLLHDKMPFPKKWGNDVKENNAYRWSLLRLASNGSTLLNNEANRLNRPGYNTDPKKADNMRASAKICRELANISLKSDAMDDLRSKHTSRFIALLAQTYSHDQFRYVIGKLEARLAINLAEGIIQNAGISLDRIFGLPIIPGSAVKGVTRAAALEELKFKSDAETFRLFAEVFGVAECEFKPNGDLAAFCDLRVQCGIPADSKGAVCFLSASPVSKTDVVVDITNVHTPKYYTSPTSNTCDLREETPRPNPFPAVEKGAEFAFPLVLNTQSADSALLDAAERWLIAAMTVHGLGAKTGAGYGWFSKTEAKVAAAENPSIQAADVAVDPDVLARLSTLKPDQIQGMVNKFVAERQYWTTPESEQRALLEIPLALELWNQNKANPKSKFTKGFKNLANAWGVQLP